MSMDLLVLVEDNLFHSITPVPWSAIGFAIMQMPINTTLSVDISNIRVEYNSPRWSLCLAVSLGMITLLHHIFRPRGADLVQAPRFGSFFPYISKWQYFFNAWKPILAGYRSFKQSAFKVGGNETLILSGKYAAELRNIDESRLSSMVANIDNFQGNYSTVDILLQGNLHTRAIQTRLTPKLGKIIDLIMEEVKYGISKEVPPAKDHWVSITGWQTFVRLVAHDFARISLGFPLCRDPRWRDISINYPENVFITVIVMRLVPNWLKPILNWIVPFNYFVAKYVRQAKELIVPTVLERRKMEADRSNSAYQKPDDFLQMMMDEAQTSEEANPTALVHRMLVMAMAAVHTTSMAGVQALFDMLSRPEYIEPIRQEMVQAIREDGGLMKTTLTKMRKLDSFMKESQRVNPPSLTGFKRYVADPAGITLSDGRHLPCGTLFCMPVSPMANDGVPDPDTFDGFRWYRKRQCEEGQSNLHQFAMTDLNNMHFGHGRYACPGRFLAANSIKVILINLLLRYEVRLEGGTTSRPANVPAHEYIFPNPWAKIELREREDVTIKVDSKVVFE